MRVSNGRLFHSRIDEKRKDFFVPLSTNEGEAEIIGRTETITRSFRNEIKTFIITITRFSNLIGYQLP